MGKSKKQTIGFRYFMGLHMAICHGPVDEIKQIYVAQRSLELPPVTGNGSLVVLRKDLFGGDKKEGGIVATIDYEFGASNQTPNAYLTEQFGPENPAYRGVTCLVAREYSGGEANYTSSGGGAFVAAMSPYPKPWAVEVLDIPGEWRAHNLRLFNKH